MSGVVFWRAVRDGYSYEAATAKQRQADELVRDRRDRPMSETCWHSQCALDAHGMDERIHETESGKAFRAPLDDPAPIDWPARFRAAAEVVTQEGWSGYGNMFRALGTWVAHRDADLVEAIGRALLDDMDGEQQ
jgi:hypothetical protein